jgi:hypothetical protein
MIVLSAVVGGCADEQGKAEQLAPPLRPISPEATTRAQDPRFDEYRKLLRAQFEATKQVGDFYRKATGEGSRPMSAEDLDRHGALRGESDRRSAECAAYIEANFPDESTEVIQQIYNEEQARAFPDG